MHNRNVLFDNAEAGRRLVDWIKLLICDRIPKLLAELLGEQKTQTELYVTILIGNDSPSFSFNFFEIKTECYMQTVY